MTLLYLLLIAHLLGDFILQPNSWVESKFNNGIQSTGLWKHIGVHAILLTILGFIFPSYYISFIIIGVSHAIIDIIKIEFHKIATTKTADIIAFILDQTAHLLIILLVLNYTQDFIDWKAFIDSKIILISLGYLFITIPVGKIISILISPYTDVIKNVSSEEEKTNWRSIFFEKGSKANNTKELEKGGMYIGILERIFVFSFILFGQWAAVGFLVTAKSVFRFGDLNKGKNRAFTEYVLIGTLLSFGLAIISAIIIKSIL